VYTLLKSSLWRYFAEFVGTFILVLFGDGVIVASTLTGQPNFGFIKMIEMKV
jgi:glycerol uptake facilitator protein